MKTKRVIMALLGSCLFAAPASAGDEVTAIIRRLDTNEVFKTMKADAELTIRYGGKQIVKRFDIQTKGDKNSFVEFTNPEDAGTRMLKKDGNLFIYSPDAEEVVPITGHMLKESMMGSDLSYEDTVSNDTYESLYDARIVEDTEYGGTGVWLIELTGKKKTVSYPKLRMWVDKKTYVPLKTERYALSGTILKEELVLETKEIKGKQFPVKVEIRDLLRKDSKTIFSFNNITLDEAIPDSVFSMRNLER
jgi:outer membrane lipoprotein-sorting protein